MSKAGGMFATVAVVLALASVSAAQANPCPGYDPSRNTNLACAISTAAPGQSNTTNRTTQVVGTTMATQLSQLPISTAVSGAGLVFDPSIGTWRVSQDVGPILTQRGDTIGRHAALLSFTYQRFGFSSIDGIDLKHLNIVNSDTSGNIFAAMDTRIDFRVDQFVALGTFGLTNRIDVTMVVPFSFVTLNATRRAYDPQTGTGSVLYNYGVKTPLGGQSFPGSASGIGDVLAGFKANVFKSKSEKTSIAIGTQVRMPSGDALNYLGSGAWGFRPYMVISHRGRVTPNASIGYQWNSASVLYQDANGNHQVLPSSFLYSGGVDVRISGRASVTGEFLGQYVINGPRLGETTTGPSGSPLTTAYSYTGSYAMDNGAVGVKLNPFKGLFISASAMFKLDDPGLRANVVPLVGIAYRF